MLTTCFKKCVPKFHESEMHVGELSCIDRCIFKYYETTQLTQKVFEDVNKNQLAAANGGQQFFFVFCCYNIIYNV